MAKEIIVIEVGKMKKGVFQFECLNSVAYMKHEDAQRFIENRHGMITKVAALNNTWVSDDGIAYRMKFLTVKD